MAKKAKVQKSIEATLWSACDDLRGSIEPSEYKHVILSLIFLKYANDKFDAQRQKMIDAGESAFLEMEPFYARDNVFFIPEEGRWNKIKSKSSELATAIDTAFNEIEKKNSSLAGALPNKYFSETVKDNNKLKSLLDKMETLDMTSDPSADVFGRCYEYFLYKFAIKEGKGKGEFYTPKTIVSLLCELIEPYEGIVYDGACGSGGMFVQSAKFIEEHKGNKKDISIYGQEYTPTTYKLARMNLAVRGIAANLGPKAASTFQEDQHKDLKIDYALMNPPFNQKAWRKSGELESDPRWIGYKTPAESNANYAWILNMVSKLNQNGVGALILANGALSEDGMGYEIRKQLIENDLVEAIIILPRDMFYATDISVTIWIFNKNKKARTVVKNGEERKLRDRSNEILFIDYRQGNTSVNEDKEKELSPEDRKNIYDIYHNWQSVDKDIIYKDTAELCYSAKKEEIAKMDYNLAPSKYIEFVDHDLEIDFEKEMKRIQLEMKNLMEEEKSSQKALIDAFGGIGYGIE